MNAKDSFQYPLDGYAKVRKGNPINDLKAETRRARRKTKITSRQGRQELPGKMGNGGSRSSQSLVTAHDSPFPIPGFSNRQDSF
jgi:hypothetical protein